MLAARCTPGLFPSKSPFLRLGRFSLKPALFTMLRSNRGCSRLAGVSQSSPGYTNVAALRSSLSLGKARWKILVAETVLGASDVTRKYAKNKSYSERLQVGSYPESTRPVHSGIRYGHKIADRTGRRSS